MPVNINDKVLVIPEGKTGYITAKTDGLYVVDGRDAFDASEVIPWDGDDIIIEVSLKNPCCTPERHGDWVDLKAASTYTYEAGDAFIVSLGVAMKLPRCYEAILAPRSSAFGKYGVIQTNSIGIIDGSYCGNNDIWGMPVYALKSGVINEGDRIAQFRLVKTMDAVRFDEVAVLHGKERGGFGSTGR